MPVIRIADFDTWRPGYGLAAVSVVLLNTDTLANVYTDEALTAAASNPQTLLERITDGISYGKWAEPLYTDQAVELQINSVDQTGSIRPALTTLDGESVSSSVAIVTGGSIAIDIADHLARRIDVRDYGAFVAVGGLGASSATNNATILSAIGAAGAAGGGYVEIPAGTYAFNSLTIPEGVILRGPEKGAATLQSTYAGNVLTLGGERAGLSCITLDGVSQTGLSVGVYGVAKDKSVMDDVIIKRFETPIYCRGSQGANWRNLYISDCVSGPKLHGDTDAGNGGLGGPFRHNRWVGGGIELASTVGLDLQNVDAACSHNWFENLRFEDNTGIAVQIVGARSITLVNPYWSGNTTNIDADDGDPLITTNTVIDILIDGGIMDGGTLDMAGNLESVIFNRLDISDVDVTLTTPGHNITVLDCREDDDVTIAGIATAWLRQKTDDKGASFGITTGNTATKAWALTLESGQKVYLEGRVVGRQRNGVNTGFYHIVVSAGRPGASLDYDTQTANFTVGDTLTGANSGATARIVADSDSGATGTLTLQDVVGVFVDDEIVTDVSGGSATANGAISESDVALVGSVAALRAAQETNANWDATFVANGPQIELRVTGDSSQTVEWTCDVGVVST